MPIDLGEELTLWIRSPEGRGELRSVVREAVSEIIRKTLDEELLDTKQAAGLLGMTPAAVRKAVERGQLPCVRMGRRLRFRRSELLRVADSRGQQ